MLAYAASAPRCSERRSSPNALLVIVAGHVALLAVVMSARMDLPSRLLPNRPIQVDLLPSPPPEPNPQAHRAHRPSSGPTETVPPFALPEATPIDLSSTPTPPDPGPNTGAVIEPVAEPLPIATSVPVRVGAVLSTSPRDLKPPYPVTKLASGAEAVLKLKLTIDELGRVIAVEPIGRADPVFLAAARRHLLAHWHYRPATEDGRAVASTNVVTLRFQLDG